MLQAEFFPLTLHMYSKPFRLIEDNGHISRDLLCQELNLGEGSIKTLIKHLKMQDLIETSRIGTKMSVKGNRIFLTYYHLFQENVFFLNVPLLWVDITMQSY